MPSRHKTVRIGVAFVAFGIERERTLAADGIRRPETTAGRTRFEVARSPEGSVTGSPRPAPVLLYGTAFLTELLLFGAVLTAVPFLLTASFAVAPTVIGLILAAGEVSSVIVSALNGRFAKRVSNHGLIALGLACNGISLLGLWLAPSPLSVGDAVLVVGAGMGLSMPAVDAAIADLVSARHRAGALSVRNSTTFLGRSVGPVLFAGLAVATGYRPLLLAAGVVALTSGVVAVLAAEHDANPITLLEELA